MKQILCALLLMTSIMTSAQPDGKVFTVTNGSYTNLTNPIVVTTPFWDDFNASFPLGFNFTLMGQTTNTLYITDSTSLGGDVFLSTTGFINGIGNFNDYRDRASNGYSPSTVSYKVDGVAGQKIAKIQWKDVGHYGDTIGTDSVNQQLWIYEGSNDVEVRFGPSHVISNPGWIYKFFAPTQGFIKGLETTGFTFEWLHFVKSLSPAVMDSANYATIIGGAFPVYNSYPASGTIMRWAKPSIGIKGISLNDQLTVYPTCFQDRFSLSVNAKKFKGTLSLIDMNGRMVLTQQVAAGVNNIHTSQLASGIYTLAILSEGQSVYYKISKN